jgi:hypothetical protein
MAREDSLACNRYWGDAAYRWLMKRSQPVHMTIPRTILQKRCEKLA